MSNGNSLKYAEKAVQEYHKIPDKEPLKKEYGDFIKSTIQQQMEKATLLDEKSADKIREYGDILVKALDYGPGLLRTAAVYGTPAARMYQAISKKQVLRPKEDILRAIKGEAPPIQEYLMRGGAPQKVAMPVGTAADIALGLSPNIMAKTLGAKAPKALAFISPSAEKQMVDEQYKSLRELIQKGVKTPEKIISKNIENITTPGAVGSILPKVKQISQTIFDPTGKLTQALGEKLYQMPFRKADQAAKDLGIPEYQWPSKLAEREGIVAKSDASLAEQLSDEISKKEAIRGELVGIASEINPPLYKPDFVVKKLVDEPFKSIENKNVLSQGADLAKAQILSDIGPTLNKQALTIEDLDRIRKAMTNRAKSVKAFKPSNVAESAQKEALKEGYKKVGAAVNAQIVKDLELQGPQYARAGKEQQSLILAQQEARKEAQKQLGQKAAENPIAAITTTSAIPLWYMSRNPYLGIPLAGAGLTLGTTAGQTTLGLGLQRGAPYLSQAVREGLIYGTSPELINPDIWSQVESYRKLQQKLEENK